MKDIAKFRKKALSEMDQEPMIKIVMKAKPERESEEKDDGMIMMKVSLEEKEMILAKRGEESPEQKEESDEQEPAKSFNPFKKKA